MGFDREKKSGLIARLFSPQVKPSAIGMGGGVARRPLPHHGTDALALRYPSPSIRLGRDFHTLAAEHARCIRKNGGVKASAIRSSTINRGSRRGGRGG